MSIREAERVVLETTATRDKAEALLGALRRARDESSRQMQALGMTDKLREATGRSIYDNAIESTQQMVDTLSACVREMRRGMELGESYDGQRLTAGELEELRALDAETLGGEPSRHDDAGARARSTAAQVAATSA